MVKQDGAQIHSFLCFNLANAISTGESFLDYLPFQRGLLWLLWPVARTCHCTAPVQRISGFTKTLSTGCSVHFQHKFNYNSHPINIWEE